MMNERINAIKQYLKFFPNESAANSNLILYEVADELGIDIDSMEWYKRPTVQNCCVLLGRNIKIVRRYSLTNSATNYKHDGEEKVVVIHFPYGRLDFVSDKYWNDIQEEWDGFMDVLKSYKPLDYDDWNDKYIYNMENGKKLIDDFDTILSSFKKKVDSKIKQIDLQEKRMQFEALKAELSEVSE